MSQQHRVTLLCPDAGSSIQGRGLPAARAVTYPIRSRLMALIRGVRRHHLYHGEHRARLSSSALHAIDLHSRFDYVWTSMLYPMSTGLMQLSSTRNSRLIWDTHNNDLEVFSAFANTASPKALYALTQLNAVKNWMQWTAARAESVVACTSEDSASIGAIIGRSDVVLAKNGVDLRHWLGAPRPTPDQERYIIFGSLFPQGHTSRGAIRFLSDHWPSVAKNSSGAALMIAGSSPGRALERAVRSAPGDVKLVADPEDMVPVVKANTHILVPSYGGHGSKIKMYEALATGLPVTATPEACVGLEARFREMLTVVQRHDWVAALRQSRLHHIPDGQRLETLRGADWEQTLAPALELVRD